MLNEEVLSMDDELEMWNDIANAHGFRDHDWPELLLLGHTESPSDGALKYWKLFHHGIDLWEHAWNPKKFEGVLKEPSDFVPFLQLRVRSKLFSRKSDPDGADGHLNLGIRESDLKRGEVHKLVFSTFYD